MCYRIQVKLLTKDELKLAKLLGKVANKFTLVFGSGHDLDEAVDKVHQLQAAVLSQAAARAYPKRFRLLGEKK